MEINEDINPHKAQWKQRLLEFDTQSLWELLEIRFFDHSNQLSSLLLLGSFQVALNSIYFDDD